MSETNPGNGAWRLVGRKYAPIFYADESRLAFHNPFTFAALLAVLVAPRLKQEVGADALALGLWSYAIDPAFNLFNDGGVVTPFFTSTRPEVVLNMFAENEIIPKAHPERKLFVARHMVGIAFRDVWYYSKALGDEMVDRITLQQRRRAEDDPDALITFINASMARDTIVRRVKDKRDSATPGYEFIAKSGTAETDAQAAERYNALCKQGDTALLTDLRRNPPHMPDSEKTLRRAVVAAVGQTCIGAIHGIGLALASTDEPLARSQARL